MGNRGRIGLGGLFVAIGLSAWMATWSWLGPAPVGEAPGEHSVPGWLVDQIASVSARWTAVAVGVGGLVLAARVWRAGIGLAVALGVVWLGADALLDLSDMDTRVGPAATAAAVAVAAVVLLATGWRRGTGSGPAWSLLIYAGVLVALSPSPLVYRGLSGEDETRWLPLLLLLLTPAIALAAIMALAAGPWPPSRRRAWGLAIGLILLAGAAVAARAEPGSVGWLLLAPVTVAPILLATLVSLTGVLPSRGRAVVACGGLVLGGVVVGAPLAFAALSGPWPAQLGAEAWGLGAAWAIAAGTVISGVLLGAGLVVGAGAVRRFAQRVSPADRMAGLQSPRPAGASLAGGLLALVGTAGWVMIAVDLQPRTATLVEQWLGQGFLSHGLDGTYSFAGLGWDLRWAAIVLAASGLRLLAWGQTRRRGVVVGIGAWFAVDLLLVATAVVPRAAVDWVVVAFAGVVLAAGAALAARRHGTAPSPGRSFVYSGALIGVGMLLLSDARIWIADHVPLVVPVALTALLVLAGVITALVAAPPPRGPGRVVAAAGVATVGVGTVLALDWWRLTGEASPPARTLVCALVLAGTVLACGLLAGVVPARHAGGRLSGTAGLLAVGAPGVLVGAAVAAFLALLLGNALIGTVLDLTGPYNIDEGAHPLTVYGAFAGSSFAAIALFAREMSTLDTPAAEPESEHSTPAPPTPSAPRAASGVPEVLEWPPPRTLAGR